MGNALDVFVPAATAVKVYHGDNGHLLQFSCRPMSSGKLMRRHPNYLLVYSVVKVKQMTFTAAAVAAAAIAQPGHFPQLPQHTVHIRLVQPGDILQIGRSYFLVFIPEQYRAAFAKYFTPRKTKSAASYSTAAPPRPRYYNYSPSASPQYSPTRYPQPIRTRSVTSARLVSPRVTVSPLLSAPRSPRSPRAPRPPLGTLLSTEISGSPRSVGPRDMTKQSSYGPSPLRGNPGDITRDTARDTSRASNNQYSVQDSSQNSVTEADRTHSPAPTGQGSPKKEETTKGSMTTDPNAQQRNRITLGNIINQDLQGSPNRSPVSSPVRATPVVQDTRRSMVNHNFQHQHQQQSPMRTVMGSLVRASGRVILPPSQDQLRTILHHNLQQRSPGRPLSPAGGYQVPIRSFGHRSPGSSPYYLNNPQRSSQLRPRSTGMRS
ncbi:unnamed protein product [Calypogeia fissa]